jgi:predicted acyltransferase
MPPSQRFLALDVFRGMTICFMIIVNTPGTWEYVYKPLHHAPWHGFTVTDLVFPSFLFAVGNALSFVMNKWEKMPQSAVLWKILKRTFIIFFLGFLLYWFPFIRFDAAGNMMMEPLAETRIPGVLQRIALCYGIAALMLYYFKPKATVIITIIMLVMYGPLLWYFGDQPDPLSLQGNAILKSDRWLIGEKHMYHGEGIAFDPEGFLSTLPAVANVVGGFLAGRFLQVKGKTYEALTKLLLAGAVLITIAYFWDLSFPINKKLWTSSYAVYTIGIACVIIATIIYVIDFRQKLRWTYFFEVFGKNPLFIYLIASLASTLLGFIKIGDRSVYSWIYRNIFAHAGNYLGSLLFAIAFMLACWMIGWWMDRRKIYVKV